MGISHWRPMLRPCLGARPWTPARFGRWRHCYHPSLCPSRPTPICHHVKQACVTALLQVPRSRDQSGQRPDAARPPPQLVVPMPPAALTLVPPDQQHRPDQQPSPYFHQTTKLTHPGRSFLGSNRSKESLFLNSALKTYNSKRGGCNWQPWRIF